MSASETEGIDPSTPTELETEEIPEPAVEQLTEYQKPPAAKKSRTPAQIAALVKARSVVAAKGEATRERKRQAQQSLQNTNKVRKLQSAQNRFAKEVAPVMCVY